MALAAVALFVGAAVLAVAWVLLVLSGHPINWYRLHAPDLLTVEVTTGPVAWTRVTDVTETATRVTVTVKSLDLTLGPQTMEGYPRQLAVRLAQALGSRLVYDATGQQVPLYHPPEPAPSPTPSAGSEPPLSVANGTTIPVTLVVNGSVIETVPAGQADDPIATPLPPRPWSIEARSPSGLVLLTLAVTAQDYIANNSGVGARADLACGRLDIWSGPPLLGPAFDPDLSKPCD